MAGLSPSGRVKIAIAAAALGAVLAAGYYVTTLEESPARSISVFGWALRYEIAPVEDDAELEELHRLASDAWRGQCVACHGDRKDSELVVHRIHLESRLLPGLECQHCHTMVELGPRDETTITRWVDVGFCKTCHSEFPGGKVNPHKCDVDDAEEDCLECHVGDMAPRHEPSYLPAKVTGEDCKGCHGGRVLPWTPGHEEDDWLDLHGIEALDSAGETCFECHDFGLKFCNECHQEKPASHLPADDWRLVHHEQAQADTRVCYTCHETSYCKGCHVNHEEGWMEAHPTFVKERGDQSCEECHSLTSCSYCHTDQLLLGEGASLETTSQ